VNDRDTKIGVPFEIVRMLPDFSFDFTPDFLLIISLGYILSIYIVSLVIELQVD
jgi:hypothetical protein